MYRVCYLLVFFLCFFRETESGMIIHSDASMAQFEEILPYENPVIFHCYWNGELNEKHLISIESCYLTNIKKHKNYKIILWVENEVNNFFFSEVSRYCEIRKFNLRKEIEKTFLRKVPLRFNKQLAFYSDVVRKILLYKYGGCWFDLDVLFLKDFSKLFQKFKDSICVYRWGGESYPNGAIYFSLQPYNPDFEKNILFIVQRHKGWGFQEALLTFDLPLKMTVLPCEWFDMGWINNNLIFNWNSFFSSTDRKINLPEFAENSFAFHWHNKWSWPIQENSPIRQLVQQLRENN